MKMLLNSFLVLVVFIALASCAENDRQETETYYGCPAVIRYATYKCEAEGELEYTVDYYAGGCDIYTGFAIQRAYRDPTRARAVFLEKLPDSSKMSIQDKRVTMFEKGPASGKYLEDLDKYYNDKPGCEGVISYGISEPPAIMYDFAAFSNVGEQANCAYFQPEGGNVSFMYTSVYFGGQVDDVSVDLARAAASAAAQRAEVYEIGIADNVVYTTEHVSGSLTLTDIREQFASMTGWVETGWPYYWVRYFFY